MIKGTQTNFISKYHYLALIKYVTSIIPEGRDETRKRNKMEKFDIVQ